MTIVDQANNAEYDFERASWSGLDQLSVWSGSELPVSGAEATGLGGNADAGSLGLLGGSSDLRSYRQVRSIMRWQSVFRAPMGMYGP